MKVQDLMSAPAVSIGAGESVEVAARTLARYNIGALPVCGSDGRLCGMVTDRDLVTRCLAANRNPAATPVRDVMTRQVVCADVNMELGVASHLMGRQQVRRLPVVREGKLCGMLSLGDMAVREDAVMDAADALADISGNITE